MSNWNGLILTTKGQSLKAKVEADECQLELTKFKIGNGQIAEGQTLEGLTDLVSPKQVITINTLTAEGSVCKIGGVITNVDLEEGYEIRELGLFATDPDDGEILYAITIDNHPDYLQPEGSATVISEEFECNISMTNAANVTAVIGTAGLATIGNVQTMIEAHNADSTAHADKFAEYLPLSGGNITGALSVGGESVAVNSKLSMPSNTKISISLPAFPDAVYTEVYTAATDGWFAAAALPTSTDGYILIKNNANIMQSNVQRGTSNSGIFCVLPVPAGYAISIYKINVSFTDAYFVPSKSAV